MTVLWKRLIRSGYMGSVGACIKKQLFGVGACNGHPVTEFLIGLKSGDGGRHIPVLGEAFRGDLFETHVRMGEQSTTSQRIFELTADGPCKYSLLEMDAGTETIANRCAPLSVAEILAGNVSVTEAWRLRHLLRDQSAPIASRNPDPPCTSARDLDRVLEAI